ncbi:UDP-N-acetylglucosamine transferase subunit ALG13 [Dimargaris xerosporica]|nr:UDP-N-acetylglucosamine transferase subunit ALG13 [Dimargaris xerosporica]
MPAITPKRVFVTVGTTGFSALVSQATSPTVLHELAHQGYSELLVQYGSSQAAFDAAMGAKGIAVSGYAYKSSLASDLEAADLVISHAGSGTILECLTRAKPLVAVVNDSLMDNHQLELAEALAEQGYLVSTACHQLLATLQQQQFKTLRQLQPNQSNAFATILAQELRTSG